MEAENIKTIEREKILNKLKKEFINLKVVSEKQFSQRFSTSKYRDSWQDEIFKEYQIIAIRIELLFELLS